MARTKRMNISCAIRRALFRCYRLMGHDLTQSLAIIDYLDSKYPDPGILPADPAVRAQVLAQALVIIGRYSSGQ